MEHAILFLDGLHDRIHDGSATEVTRAMHDLFEGLQRIRAELGPDLWPDFLEQAWRHPLCATIHQDPMCRRSFEKPRGYAGDAPLLDYIYKLTPLDGVSRLGKLINAFAVERPAAAAVRERRSILARAIDDVAAAAAAPIRVLAIAAGHLREAPLSSALAEGRVEELIALDSDEQSLQTLRSDDDALPIRTQALSVARLMTGRYADRLGKFDFVYSAGLYDYLNPKVAASLTRTMFDCLKPGGRLLLSNFDTSVADAGYMESYMGWSLIYRDEASVHEVGASLPKAEREAAEVWHGTGGAIVYYQAVRHGADLPIDCAADGVVA